MQFARERRRRIESLVQELRDGLEQGDERSIDIAQTELQDELYDLNREAYLYEAEDDQEGGILGQIGNTLKKTFAFDDDLDARPNYGYQGGNWDDDWDYDNRGRGGQNYGQPPSYNPPSYGQPSYSQPSYGGTMPTYGGGAYDPYSNPGYGRQGYDNRPADNRPANNRPADNRPADNRPSYDNRPPENRPGINDNPGYGRRGYQDARSGVDSAYGDRPYDSRPETRPDSRPETRPDNRPAENRRYEGRPYEGRPTDSRYDTPRSPETGYGPGQGANPPTPRGATGAAPSTYSTPDRRGGGSGTPPSGPSTPTVPPRSVPPRLDDNWDDDPWAQPSAEDRRADSGPEPSESNWGDASRRRPNPSPSSDYDNNWTSQDEWL